MSALSDQKSAEAAERRRLVLAALDLAADAGLTAGDLAARTGISARALSRHLDVLAAAGLVTRDGRGPVRITAVGRSEVGGQSDDVMPALTGVLAGLPCEAYRAMVRLQLAAVIARRHLLGSHDHGWPSFLAAGDTGDGKTVIARLVCRLLGLAEPAHVRLLQNETPGSLFARRERTPGSGWRAEVSPVLSLPYVCLDELDKPPGAETKVAAWRLMQGDTEADFEGQLIRIRPLVYGCMNIDPEAGADAWKEVPRPFRRRAVTMDTRALASLLADMDESAAQLLGPGRVLPRLRLERLAPPFAALPETHRRWLRDRLKEALTAEGWRFTQTEGLALAAAGAAALMPGTSDRAARAAAVVMLDYLTITSTLAGHVQDGWAARCQPIAGWLASGSADQALPDMAAVADDQARMIKATARAKLTGQRDDLGLVADRAALGEQLRSAAEALDGRKLQPLTGKDRARAAGVRAALNSLRERVSKSRSRAALDDLRYLAAAPLAEAAQITAYLTDQRGQRERAAADANLQRHLADADRKRDREVRAAQARSRAARQRATLEETRSKATHLERLYKRTVTRTGESPREILSALGLITYQERPPAQRKSIIERLAQGRAPEGDWHVPGTAVRFPGWPGGCSALRQWGSGTRAVLALWLADLRAQEDQLCSALGRKPRRRPPLN